MLDRADCADFGCHNSIRLETKHFLNTLALTFISFSGRFVFAMQIAKTLSFFFASDPLVYVEYSLSSRNNFKLGICSGFCAQEMIASGNKEITFDQSSGDTCKALLSFIYTGELKIE